MIMVLPETLKYSGNGLGNVTVAQVSDLLSSKRNSRSIVKADKSSFSSRVPTKDNSSSPVNADTSMEDTVLVLESFMKKLLTRLGDAVFQVTPTL